MYKRTHPINQLYHQFLKPSKTDSSSLASFIEILEKHGFIETIENGQRFIRTEKIESRSKENRNELFKLIHEFCSQSKKSA